MYNKSTEVIVLLLLLLDMHPPTPSLEYIFSAPTLTKTHCSALFLSVSLSLLLFNLSTFLK